jgi:enoyl-CoA hydratase
MGVGRSPTKTLSTAVTLRVDGPVATITLDDGKANAIGLELLAALDDAMATAVADAHAVVIAGRPGRFSAGFDLAAMTSSTESMRELVTAGAESLLGIFTCPIPVVAACTGHALAAGALLLLVADRRIGADGPFKIGLNEVAIGMPLPIFGVELARYRMPPSAFDAVILGETMAPSAAVAAGFLDEVVVPDDVLGAAAAEAERLSSLRRGAIEGTKQRARGELVARVLPGVAADLASVTTPG